MSRRARGFRRVRHYSGRARQFFLFRSARQRVAITTSSSLHDRLPGAGSRTPARHRCARRSQRSVRSWRGSRCPPPTLSAYDALVEGAR